MTMQTLYRLECDEPGCGQIQGSIWEERAVARQQAREIGWAVGPFRQQTRRGRLIHHVDFCPKHKASAAKFSTEGES